MGIAIEKPVIGIIGGAGPDATVDLQVHLNKQMKIQLRAVSDQDHYRVIVDNYTCMPDRSLALRNKGPSPLQHMQTAAKNLEKLGATIITYPCNTAHAYIQEIQNSISIPILDMVDITCSHIINNNSKIKNIGVLCTNMTMLLDLYKIPEMGIIYPDQKHQTLVMQAIFAAKAGYTDTNIKDRATTEKLVQYLSNVINAPVSNLDFSKSAQQIFTLCIKQLCDQGAEAIILGCTEIPLCIDTAVISQKFNVPIFNPTAILAAATINRSKNHLEENMIAETIC
ncbi:MAG: amino acid racemase [Legionellales bacterium]|nr:amino acid racemase [Legionellales bacterium]